MQANRATTRHVQNWTTDRSKKGVDQQTPFLCGFPLFLFHRSSSMPHGPSLSGSIAFFDRCPSPVYISFDQRVRRISMYLNVPLRSPPKRPVCQRRRSPFAVRAKPRPGTAEGALGARASSLMSTGWPCQRREDGQKDLPCMSYLGPGAEHNNSVHSGA